MKILIPTSFNVSFISCEQSKAGKNINARKSIHRNKCKLFTINAIINVKPNYMTIKKTVYFVFIFFRFNLPNCVKQFKYMTYFDLSIGRKTF